MRTTERLLRLLGENRQTGAHRPLSAREWKAIAREAVRHGLAPLLYHRLQSMRAGAAPPVGIVERLRDIYVHNGLRNTAAYEEIGRVLSALGTAGIRVIVLKGAFLARHVYRDFALRPMLDLDLLVEIPALRRAAEVIGSLGYRSAGGSVGRRAYSDRAHLDPLTAPGALPVELHWTIVPTTTASVDLQQIWKTAREVEVAGTTALALSPEHLLHHLCLHLSCHHRFRVPLLQLHDVAAVLQHRAQPDSDLLATIADSHETRRFVYVVLALARRAFADAVGSTLVERFRGGGEDDWIVDTAWECLTGSWPRDLPHFDERLRVDSPAPSRLSHFQRLLFPSRDRIRSAYRLPHDSPWVYWYYLARPAKFVRDNGWETLRILLERSTPASLSRSRSWAQLDRWTLGAAARSH